MTYLAIALGGAAGSMLRYALQTALRPASGGFPWGTLVVNLLGSFLIGLCAALAERYGTQGAGSWIRPWILVGLLGGFTTFSTFSLENLHLLRSGQIVSLIAYGLISLVGGLSLAAAGYFLARA